MAEVSEISPDVLRCTVCLEDYRAHGPLKPRILPVCLHTFCEGCLEKLGQDNVYSISCPICRVFNNVFGKDGIQTLPINTKVPYFETVEEETEETNLLDFIDPDMPSCPVCGGITLFAPFGEEADITQCHTCQWVSVEMLEITERNEFTSHTPICENTDRTLYQNKGAQTQNTAPPSGRRKSLLLRMINYLR
ncbi:E3 ubiquitin- ligase TRIM56-like [Pelobates cultripes]|uniref:E3 ubiquitin- ligase TRIM56-like n=1 Tax=Pelobates cultripes TaxID=61616 RepID=A0AAD1T2E4_PELCU|nr:E3 ubiquitin- ligase TRIM56-like [Pelobates cultripes]CAH2316977.1 E3 ubiquitin- ligase TRIM56-like [Pelobates cultripes]